MSYRTSKKTRLGVNPGSSVDKIGPRSVSLIKMNTVNSLYNTNQLIENAFWIYCSVALSIAQETNLSWYDRIKEPVYWARLVMTYIWIELRRITDFNNPITFGVLTFEK